MSTDSFEVRSVSENSDEDNIGHVFGVLSKWTNYVLGWQDRFFELEDGVLVYYKNESEKQFGSRGSITVRCAIITENDVDSSRFDIATNGAVWYLKAESAKSKDIWIHALRSFAKESACCSVGDRSSGQCSVSSFSRQNTLTVIYTSNCSADARKRLFAQPHSLGLTFQSQSELSSKMNQLEKYRELARSQAERLQAHFSACTGSDPSCSSSFTEDGIALDATVAAILHEISLCLQLLSAEASVSGKRRDSCSKRSSKLPLVVQPAVLENILSDDEQEWHDAPEANLDIMSGDYSDDSEICENSMSRSGLIPDGRFTLPRGHFLFHEIDRITMEQLRYAKAGVSDNMWQLFAEEGEMRMYKMEVEIDGLVCDPLKAVHCVDGVSAREYIHCFFEPEYKKEWDETIEDMTLVEALSSDTVILHQVHKRVWPTAQRESLFWSHVRQLNDYRSSDASDLFMVCNHHCTRPDVQLIDSSNVRVGLTVAMVCETIVSNPKPCAQLTRDDIQCRIVYVSQVNPGGWVPTAALRVIYKREYPKFLRTFTKYVTDRFQGTPLCL